MLCFIQSALGREARVSCHFSTEDEAGKVGVGSSSELPHIAELISDGEITVGNGVLQVNGTNNYNGLVFDAGKVSVVRFFGQLVKSAKDELG